MRLFECQSCQSVIYFENRACQSCGHQLGYLPHANALSALEQAPDGSWSALAAPGEAWRFCANAEHDVCNWLIPADAPDLYCLACRHNEMIPDISDPGNLSSWRLIEQAKHRLFYSLLRLNLPLATRAEDHAHGLIFRFLADPPPHLGPKIMTGHDNGVITLALGEADAVERVRRRQELGELYRTLLGHFRHEIGHHYWDILVRDGGQLDSCREIFGDDTADYETALRSHYQNAAPPDWQDNFVSSYATMHPWEDFAETWAHYFHIVDTLEMGNAFGITVKAKVHSSNGIATKLDFDPYHSESMERIIDAWLPFVFAMNNVSRAMGHQDIYPFVIAPPVIRKLDYIHRLVSARLQRRTNEDIPVESIEAFEDRQSGSAALPQEPAFVEQQ
ncbi:putative zinc-binding peptidase [Roseiarcaceae bacterium H3SJ34-1]|uniref:zinc-binding metallopeptidase family protein n=1 Tax=Terripilifer ovatus TaxID=3032367 RepID=UPI003AB9ABE2|nr:putative zinc-binding peptidase [Roseiarcaceae bacterium H3SJ34-1]